MPKPKVLQRFPTQTLRTQLIVDSFGSNGAKTIGLTTLPMTMTMTPPATLSREACHQAPVRAYTQRPNALERGCWPP